MPLRILPTIIVVCLGTAGCTSAPRVLDRNGDGVITAYCLGDSNTDPNWRPHVTKWCELLAAELPAWKFVNGGFANTAAAGECFLCGRTLLAAALESTPIDVVMIALGTNDMNSPPEPAVEALLALRSQAERAKAEVLIGTIPPIFTGNTAKMDRINATNKLLAERAPRNRLIDFSTSMEPTDYHADGVHIIASGQRKRMEAALRALRNM